ncbi:DUF1282 domain-containing protein [Bacillus lacus]|uniref:DUF1282 domain-containing protein n=1 Tax=Metabacillus lacus TaxID=1983721 RepID=A0A7X2LZ66_9BACI|nr:YIP1 family protein [Metabacillus lacus]MRX71617.1 DUF1282 domain-containing protein [Metabacillus lacus]
MEQQTVTTETEQVRKPSLLGMIFSPGEQFDRIRMKPIVLVPLLIVVILGTLIAFLVVSSTDYSAVLTEQGLPAEGEEAAAFQLITQLTGVIGGIIIVPLVILISAAIYFAVTKIAGSDVSFKQIFSLSIFLSFISTLGGVLNTLLAAALNLDPEVYLTSLQSLVGAEGALGGILSGIEVFSIWVTVLSALGLQKVAGLSKTASWVIAIILFIGGLILAAAGGAFEGAL